MKQKNNILIYLFFGIILLSLVLFLLLPKQSFSKQENRVLISNIAHDLKTPITAVKGYAEGLVDGVADTPEKLNRYVQTIYNKANEMPDLETARIYCWKHQPVLPDKSPV